MKILRGLSKIFLIISKNFLYIHIYVFIYRGWGNDKFFSENFNPKYQAFNGRDKYREGKCLIGNDCDDTQTLHN